MPQWVWKVEILPKIRLSGLVCPDHTSTNVLEFPTKEKIKAYVKNGLLPHLAGIEDGKCSLFNFILSNGDKSNKTDQGVHYKARMMPQDAYRKIRTANIYYWKKIEGFKFFDKRGKLIFKTGVCDAGFECKVDTVLV